MPATMGLGQNKARSQSFMGVKDTQVPEPASSASQVHWQWVKSEAEVKEGVDSKLSYMEHKHPKDSATKYSLEYTADEIVIHK